MTEDAERDAVIEKWVAALRSGKYQQGVSYLRSKFEGGEKHCCLGVLCDVTEGIEWKERQTADHTHWAAAFNNSFSTSVVPVTLASAIHLKTTGHFAMKDVSEKWQKRINKLRGKFGGDHCMLITLNDLGMPFNEIADLIDENREAFFG